MCVCVFVSIFQLKRASKIVNFIRWKKKFEWQSSYGEWVFEYIMSTLSRFTLKCTWTTSVRGFSLANKLRVKANLSIILSSFFSQWHWHTYRKHKRPASGREREIERYARGRDRQKKATHDNPVQVIPPRKCLKQ